MADPEDPRRPELSPPDPARDRRVLNLLTILAALVCSTLALASTGFKWQDEYAHLLFSRWLFTHPELAVDLWGRPLATLVYAPGALVGLWAPRLCTVALAVLAARWTADAARARGLSAPLAFCAVMVQPVFFEFSFGALPGTLFAAIFARFLLDDQRGKPGRAAVMAALLPLARVEGVLIVAVYAVVLLRRGDRRLALVPFAGLAAWNAAGWMVTGELLFLLTRNPYPVVGSIYATAGWAYLARALPAAAGAALLILAEVGVVATARRPRMTHAIAAVVAVFLTLIWGVPLFASTATDVYLIGFAPLLALFAAEGWRWIATHPRSHRWLALLAVAHAIVSVPRATLPYPSRWLGAAVSGRERIALAVAFAVCALAFGAAAGRVRALGAGLALAAVLNVAPVATPVSRDAHQRVAFRAAAWTREHEPRARVISVAPDYAWYADTDPFVDWEPGALPDDVRALARVSPDVLIAWDSEFSAREGGTSLASLHDAGFADVARFAEGGVEFRILRKRS